MTFGMPGINPAWITLMLVILIAVIGLIAYLVYRHTEAVAAGRDMARYDSAAAAAAGEAYRVAVLRGHDLRTSEGQEAAIAAGAEFLATDVKAAVSTLRTIVGAHLGKLLALDPTVTAGGRPVV